MKVSMDIIGSGEGWHEALWGVPYPKKGILYMWKNEILTTGGFNKIKWENGSKLSWLSM